MKNIFFATLLLATIPAMAADDPKPLPQDTQVKMLKSQRQMQQIQIELINLQAQMENDCVAAAKESNVDLAKFTCDMDKLAFAPKVGKTEAAQKK
jgi:hypothetical protein